MLSNFSQWWDTLDGLLRALYCIAFPSTLLLVIQTLLAMFGMHNGGMGHDFSDTSGLDMHVDTGGLHDLGGIDHDIGALHDISGHDAAMHHSVDGGDPGDFATMHLFTLQTMVTFLTVASWSSIVLLGSDVPRAIALTIGFIIGVVTMLLVAKLVQLSARLAENGTVNLRNAIGESATVYIPCPPKNQGMGKVTLTIQGQLREFGAFNNSNETLPTGSMVTVVDIRGDDLVVEKEE